MRGDDAEETPLARRVRLHQHGFDARLKLALATRIEAPGHGGRPDIQAWFCCEHDNIDSAPNQPMFLAWRAWILALQCPAAIGMGSPTAASNATFARANANCTKGRGGFASCGRAQTATLCSRPMGGRPASASILLKRSRSTISCRERR